jgi:hypothetical protein
MSTKLTPEGLKKTHERLGYAWHPDKLNLVGIRSSLSAPDVFNDLFCAVWTQPFMPAGLDTLAQQRWLNQWHFHGTDNKPLKEDGLKGSNTTLALQEYNLSKGRLRMRTWSVTTEPGVFYQKNPLSKLGAAVLVPGQYPGAYQLGLHQGKSNHPALVQTGGKVKVYRDNDRNGVADETGVIEEGLFGINIHRANPAGSTAAIGKHSAGCQVFQKICDHRELLELCERFKPACANRFSYTLLRERELV